MILRQMKTGMRGGAINSRLKQSSRDYVAANLSLMCHASPTRVVLSGVARTLVLLSATIRLAARFGIFGASIVPPNHLLETTRYTVGRRNHGIYRNITDAACGYLQRVVSP